MRLGLLDITQSTSNAIH